MLRSIPKRRSTVMLRRVAHATAVAAVFVAAAGCHGRSGPWEGVTPQDLVAVEQHRVRGIALLEISKTQQPPETYTSLPAAHDPGRKSALDLAVEEFQAIIRAAPYLSFGYANLAVAYLEMPTPHTSDALAAAQEARQRLPHDARVLFILASAQRLAGKTEDAIRTLEEAARSPDAPVRVLYQLVNMYRGAPTGREVAIARLLERIVRAAPNNLVAQLEWALAAAQIGQTGSALAALSRAETLAGPGALEKQYLKNARAPLQAGNGAAAVGPLASLRNVSKQTPRYSFDYLALAGEPSDPYLMPREFAPPPPAALRPSPASPAAVRFVDATAEWGLPMPAKGHSAVSATPGNLLAVADYDEDGRPDLFVADPGGHSRLWRNTGRRFEDVTQAVGLPPLAASSARFVDVDNDRHFDLVVTAPQGIRYFHHEGSRFVDRTAAAGLQATAGSRQTLFADLDHDGNLDLVDLMESGRVRLFRNYMDGRFEETTRTSGLASPLVGLSAAAFGMFAPNGALDLLMLSHSQPSRLFLNQFGARFQLARGFGDSVPAGATAAVVEDFDHDSYLDLAIVGRRPAADLLLHNEQGRRFKAEGNLKTTLGTFVATGLVSLDFDNDGWRDLAVVGPAGARLLQNLDGHHFRDRSDLLPPVSGAVGIAAADIDGDGDADLLIAHAGGGVSLLRNDGGSRSHWSRVRLWTQEVSRQRSDPHKIVDLNNSNGIGNTIELKAGSLYQKQIVMEPVTLFGLGAAAPIDVSRVVMTNGTPQSQILPGTDQSFLQNLHIVTSCPFLYTWDGSRYRFVTDVLWRGPLGLRVSADRFAPHDQTSDYVKIPRGAIQPTDGLYDLTITEELWETTYLDMAHLVAVDHPASADVYVDERMNFGPPLPFRLYTARRPRAPRSVIDGHGHSWLKEVARRDGIYSYAFERTRYHGVTKPSELIMDLGLLPPGAPVRLFLTGWIFPTGSSVNVAVSHHRGMPMIPPRIAVTDRRGNWKTIIPVVGYPTGRNKTMVIELGRFEGPEHRVRLTTTAELYWDQIFFTAGEPPAPIRTTAMKPVASALHYLGYCREYRESENSPFLYDHSRVEPGPHWRDQEGLFTRYGEVTPLLQKADDQYVIMNSGDAVWIRFDGRRLPPLPSEWVRDFVLITDGWDKDADPNTAACTTVAPLPFHGMKHYPYAADERYPDRPALRAYRAAYNTRRVTSRPFQEALLRGHTPYRLGP